MGARNALSLADKGLALYACCSFRCLDDGSSGIAWHDRDGNHPPARSFHFAVPHNLIEGVVPTHDQDIGQHASHDGEYRRIAKLHTVGKVTGSKKSWILGGNNGPQNELGSGGL